MCGIVGVVSSKPVARRTVVQMRDRLEHRGPDAAGSWESLDGTVALGHRRLAIIDLSAAANQPFLSVDGRTAVVLNGEIYNYRTLRQELELLGVGFRTSSDTEVLLEAYRVYGESVVDRLSGMFAFAIWDEETRSLFCARDRAGEKPFYYAELPGAFVFASELKALVAWPGFGRELDQTAIVDYLTFGFVPDPKTIWQGAKKLEPGHTLTVSVDRGVPRVGAPSRYWDFEFDVSSPVSSWDEEVAVALEESAVEMSYADVPTGAFLSGGVDSSSVVAALARRSRPPRTYTIGFADAAYDERPWARAVAERYGTAHTERLAEPADVEELFREKIIWHYDEPFNDYSYLPTYLVCREARRHITVALSGDGGDEAFAGYSKYRVLARRSNVERLLTPSLAHAVAGGARTVAPPALSGRLLRYRQSADDLLGAFLTTGIQTAELRRVARGPLAAALAEYDPLDVVREHAARAPAREVGLVNAMRYLDLKLTLAGGILVKVDRASMAVSLEVRPVFLHRRMLELAGRIPPERLADGREAKKVLKSAFESWLPQGLARRPKMGFAMPLGRWLRDGALELTAGQRLSRAHELLEPRFVERTARAHLAGGDRTSALHSFFFLEHWLEQWA